MKTYRRLLAATCLALLPATAMATQVKVTITNEQEGDGLFLTPLLSVFHDGSFDTFDVGGFASPGLEALAEEGNTGIEQQRAIDAGHVAGTIISPGGFAGAPVIDPGETASETFEVDPMVERFFSYLSMVIPSNDLFIGNSNQTANEIFDSSGIFNGPRVIQVFTDRIYDGGTEEDNNLGAAFNGNNPTAATDTNEAIALQGGASVLFGETTVAGTTVGSGTGLGTLLATITVSAVPLPGAMSLMAVGLGAGALTTRRRRKG